MRDKDKYPQKEGSPVLLLEKTTHGPVAIGTRYREVVQMLPFYRGEILSKITRIEQSERLEEDFRGAGMHGHLAYAFLAEGQKTVLIQRETLRYHGVLRPCEPLIRRMLGRRLRERLEEIKKELESGSIATDGRLGP
ncbi:MAG: hypothetical protein JW852_08305 [Spirochaetales bacterium]|nr:hypothetical protein [Spirochaetales bacterium]